MNFRERLKGAAIGLGVGLSLVCVSSLLAQTNPVTPVIPGAVVTASATGTTAATAASLPAVSGKWTYICGFTITSGGTTTAAVGNATVAGAVTGTLNFTYVDVSSGQGILGVAFPQCIVASAQNTAITVTAPAGGAGTVVAVTAWGYQF
jgi:hypothetical protein